jgi:peptide/nickel transport system substrate-binding protein
VAAQTPAAGGDLIAAYNAEPPSLDPHLSPAFLTSRVTELVYNGLVRYNAAFEVEPDLAARWTISEDLLTYTFELQPNVKFHNGRPLTADDVVYSFERMLNEPNSNRKDLLGSVDKVAAADERNVTFTLKQPYVPFLANLATPGMYIVAKELVEEHGNLDNQAVGTGPFTFVEWVPKSHIKLAKNPDYFEGGKPYLDSITLQIVPEESARLAAVRTGQVHHAVLRDPTSPDVLTGEDGVQVVSVPDLNFHVIGFKTSQPPFDDVRVRQAISLAVDRQELLDTTAFGNGQVAGPVPPALTNWALPTEELPFYETDVERAKALLADAGHRDGFTATIMASPAYPEMVSDAQIVQSRLKEIGIELEIQQEEWGVYVDRWLKRDFVIYSGINGQFSSDPDYSLYPSLYTGESWNVYEFSHPEVDRLLDAGRTTQDEAARKDIYNQLQQLIAEQAPLLWTYSGMISDAVSTRLNGYVVLPNESRSSLRDAWLTPEE